jgi:hypothetical protein
MMKIIVIIIIIIIKIKIKTRGGAARLPPPLVWLAQAPLAGWVRLGRTQAGPIRQAGSGWAGLAGQPAAGPAGGLIRLGLGLALALPGLVRSLG